MNSILGFDPASLSVFTQPEVKSENQFNSNIYKARPAESKSTDGIYRATIRLVYSPQNMTRSILERQSYGLTDARGFFQVVSKLTNNDTSCPIFSAWKQCRYSKNPVLQAQAATKDKGGNGLFDKRFERYVTIQVMDDQNHPELNGKYMFWKLPKFVYEALQAKMKPSDESNKASIPVMDALFGRAIYLEVKPGPDDPNAPERRTRETSYNTTEISDDIMSCTNPDGSPLLTADEQKILDAYIEAMTPIWKSRDPQKREEMMAAVNADPNTIKLGEIYKNVIEKMKEFCPDLVAELGYNEWSEDVTKRVNDWIACVLAGKNPAAVITTSVDQVESATATVTPADTAVPPTAAPTAAAPGADDLPF
jgi:hypothetical protein